jgi:regulator of RNase E activity RraB
MFAVEVEMTQDQLISSIGQQLENLMTLDEELSVKYDAYCYYPDTDDEPIVERFTPELLKELEDLVYRLDTQND